MVRTPRRLEALRYSRLETCASVPGRCVVYRDERFPTGACDANRSRTARPKSQDLGTKGWQANARPKEHKWAVRQDVRGKQASTREAQESLMAFCRAQRRERKDRALTRGDPRLERAGKSAEAVVAFEEGTKEKVFRAKGQRTKEQNSMRSWKRLREPSETTGPDNCGQHPGSAHQGPGGEAAVSRGSGRREESFCATQHRK